ncbi:protein TIC 21, chloroplastic-like [Syzygium oleosum]|uniref:protein TIC 21, chloroplastic-like n=1 Tax=Syzygium oleosum TaxID=219896 RepID=UPI0024BB8BC4|nr:protein TIC 21, chloroplastic-like [Syzygium oleosum]
MQSLLLPAPAASSGTFPAPLGPASSPYLRRLAAQEPPLRVGHRPYLSSPNSLSTAGPAHRSNVFPLTSLSPRDALGYRRSKLFSTLMASSPVSPASTSPNDDAEKVKLAQVELTYVSSLYSVILFAGFELVNASRFIRFLRVRFKSFDFAYDVVRVAKRLENTSRYFRRLGNLGFWGQLVCTVVAAIILSFSVVITGKVTSLATFYATADAIAAAFISVFWSFGYIRLSEKLRKTANDPSKAPPRADVVKSLKNGIMLNLLGMGAAILDMQATVGLLVAKALTSSTNPN